MTRQPTATIYQNETQVIIIFSPHPDKVDMRSYRGGSVNFGNSWSDGGASGLSGFGSKKELNKFLKENNYQKKATVKLSVYCWSQHTIKNGATLTCNKKINHKDKHQAEYTSGFGSKKDNGEYKW